MTNIYEDIPCEYCKKLFTPNRSDKRFCRKTCQKASSCRRTGLKKKLRKLNKDRYHPYKKYKKDFCEDCGFIAIHPCQLDVDHIDGNHKNNQITNLKTLCANCHRLKTWQNQDWE